MERWVRCVACKGLRNTNVRKTEILADMDMSVHPAKEYIDQQGLIERATTLPLRLLKEGWIRDFHLPAEGTLSLTGKEELVNDVCRKAGICVRLHRNRLIDGSRP